MDADNVNPRYKVLVVFDPIYRVAHRDIYTSTYWLKVDFPHKEASSLLADPGLHQLVVRHDIAEGDQENTLDRNDTRVVAFDGVNFFILFILFSLKPLLYFTRLYFSIR
jgi:hypothetical protein